MSYPVSSFHQVVHWKNGHKQECFSPQEQMVGFRQQVCESNDPTTAEEADAIADKALNGNPGCALFLGTNDDNGARGHAKYEVLTDIWSMESEDDIKPSSWDVYVPHVPPALLCKAEDSLIKNAHHMAFPCDITEDCVIELSPESMCKVEDDGGIKSPIDYMHGAEPPPDLSRLRNDSTYGGDPAILKFLSSAVLRNASLAVFNSGISSETIQFLKQGLGALDWAQQIPIPNELREQAMTAVGKRLCLEGGIEMMYITPPVLCFPDLTEMEFSWLNGNANPFPIIRTPTVTYRCLEEGWQLTRLSSHVHVTQSLNSSVSFASLEKDAIFLKTFVAAAEFGDVAAIYSAWGPAKDFSVVQKLEHVFIEAAHKLLSQFIRIHPKPRREEAYFVYEIGIVHESRASWLLKDGQVEAANDELLSAARCYRLSADRTHQFSPSWFMRSCRYDALGLVLMHLGEYEMSKRALIFALTDPFTWTMSPSRTDLAVDLRTLYNLIYSTEKERSKMNKRALKDKRSYYKGGISNDVYHVSSCAYCNKTLKETRLSGSRCGQCGTVGFTFSADSAIE